MLKIITPQTRRYRVRVKRKAVKPIYISVINACIMAIAFLCIALAIPLLLIAAPFVLCAVGLLLVANACNEVGND